TGIDPTLEQWQTLAQLSVEKGWLPLFDFAYQGFARGLEEDAEVAVCAFFLQRIDEQLTHTLNTLAHISQLLFPNRT
ncbi:aminotransferase class I/II-fold pyridoxal phosphate-dependent enzyme, partial [Escherichia coli]|nr:aminotransferase class I/II-fold pyridoxal phosphate-dependent enzyme [Escherichia coli]